MTCRIPRRFFFVFVCAIFIYCCVVDLACKIQNNQSSTTNSRPCIRLRPTVIQHYSPTKLLFGDVLKRKLWKSTYQLIPSQSRVQKFRIIFVHSLCQNDKGRSVFSNWDSKLYFPPLNSKLFFFFIRSLVKLVRIPQSPTCICWMIAKEAVFRRHQIWQSCLLVAALWIQTKLAVFTLNLGTEPSRGEKFRQYNN